MFFLLSQPLSFFFLLSLYYAVNVLESFALKADDPRVKRASSRALAELCWAARQGSKSSLVADDEDAALSALSSSQQNAVEKDLSGGGAQNVKGISALSENGALRYLCETAVAGVWPIVDEESSSTDDEEESSDLNPLSADKEKKNKPVGPGIQTILSSQQAASLLRCLVDAPRLPSLDWSAACRRLVRSYPKDSAVQEACITFAAVHAAVSQAYQLYDFVSGDVLGQPGLRNWCPSAQITILDALPQLVSAIPDEEAVSVLRMLCNDCPEGSDGAAWQAALLQGLAAVVEEEKTKGRGKNVSASSAVPQTAWECAVHAVLCKLPAPTTWPLSLKLPSSSERDYYTAKESESATSSSSLHAWRSMLRCALAAPYESIISLCQDAANYKTYTLHWVWLSAAITANSGTDLRGLQQSRNLVLDLNSRLFGEEMKASFDEDTVILFIARSLTAASGVTLAQIQQWIVDVLHAAGKCTARTAAVKLAACAAVSLACSIEGNNKDTNNNIKIPGGRSRIAMNHAVLVDCQMALQALPTSVRELAESIEPCPVALLVSLVENIGSIGEEGIDLQKKCCWALREALPATVWTDLCQKIIGI